jgi:hypothetical protein
VITDVLLEKAVCVVRANHRVRKIEVFDDGLKLSLVVLSDLATEDRGDFLEANHNTQRSRSGISRAKPLAS